MRTFIIDNGQDYSYHTIYFVETNIEIVAVERLLSLFKRWGYYDEYHLVAVADGRLEWRAENEALTLRGFIAQKAWLIAEKHEAEVLAIAALEVKS